MTTRELLRKLREAKALSARDPELAHAAADAYLLDYIDNPRVRRTFESIKRWYA